jgi:hypothetical protein
MYYSYRHKGCMMNFGDIDINYEIIDIYCYCLRKCSYLTKIVLTECSF